MKALILLFIIAVASPAAAQKTVDNQTFSKAMLNAKSAKNPRDADLALFFKSMKDQGSGSFLTQIEVHGLHPTDKSLYQTFPTNAIFKNNTEYFTVTTLLPAIDKGAYTEMESSGMLEKKIFSKKNMKKYQSFKYELQEDNRLLVVLDRPYPGKMAELITPKIIDAVETLHLIYGHLAIGQRKYME